MQSKNRSTRGPYCLRCYSDLPQDHKSGRRAATTCEACGYVNVTVWRSVYWTREPLLVRIEWTLKAIIVGLCAWLTWGAVFGPPHGGVGSGWFIAGPLLLGIALWATASKLTRHVPYFAAGRFWAIAALVCGLLPLLFVALPTLLWARNALPDVATGGLLFAFAIPFALLAWGLLHLSRRLEAWKDRRRAVCRA